MAKSKIKGVHTITVFNRVDPILLEHNQKTSQENFASIINNNADRDNIPEGLPLVPEENDYHFFPFRQISETIIGSGTWKSSDFRSPGVLKNSVKLLSNIKAYKNHDFYNIDSAIGVLGKAVYSNGYTNDNGGQVPAGLDAPFIIDGVLHPKLVRQLNSKYSKPIDSASVTIEFEWESSHEFEDDRDFFYHVGEMIDGKEVTRVATRIIRYIESSLVYDGADPFAKMLSTNGQVSMARMFNENPAELFLNPKFDDDPLSEVFIKRGHFYVMDCLDNKNILDLSKSSFNKPKQTSPKMNKELQQFLMSFFGIEKEEELTKASFDGFSIVKKEDHSTLKKKATSYDALVEKAGDKTPAEFIEGLQTEVSDFKKEVEENKLYVEAGKTQLSAAKEKVKTLYTTFSNGKTEEILLKEIEEETSLEKLEAKAKTYGGQLFYDLGGKCSECGSTKIQMKSSKDDDLDNDGPDEEQTGNTLVDSYRR